MIGAAPDEATHWGLQRRRPGEKDERKGWTTLAFPAGDDGVCLYEVPVDELSLAAIRDCSEGAGGQYRIRWLGEDEHGVPKQLSFGRHFTLAVEGREEPPAVAPTSRARPAAPAASGSPDLMGIMLQMLASDRDAARGAQERSDREAREAREEQRRREDREREDARRRDERDRVEADRKWDLEKERLRAELADRAAQTQTLASIAKAIEASAAQVAELAERLDDLESDDDNEEPDEPQAEGWPAVVKDLVPVIQRGADAVMQHLTSPGGAAE